MAYTQAQLDALKKAYASGALEVEYNGRRVRYRSLNEMAQIIEAIEAAISPAAAAPRTSYVTFSRE
jgi:hypothetical protein